MQDEMQDGFLRDQYFQGFEQCDTGESNPVNKSRRIQCLWGFWGLFFGFRLAFFRGRKPAILLYWSFATNKMQDEMQDENRLKV